MDLVIPWVDTSDLLYQSRRNQVLNNKIITKDLLRLGNRISLKYCLRSIYKNLNWINKIFLITDDQYPKWLNEKLAQQMVPKIIRVDHKDINPEKQSMYSSIAIEACLSKIDRLSEYFLYSNDDMFVCKTMKKQDWLSVCNKGYLDTNQIINNEEKFKYKNILWYDRFIIDQIKLFDQLFNDSSFEFHLWSHFMTVLHKDSIDYVESKFPELMQRTRQMVGRQDQKVISRMLYEYVALKNKACISKNDIKQIYLDADTDYKNYSLDPDIQLLCTNINCAFKQNEENDYILFLEKLFPEKLECEI